MLTVKTKIKPSRINGFGLFANQNIKKSQIIWKYNPIIDYKISPKKFKRLPSIAKKSVLHYCYADGYGNYIMFLDNARFFNHSKKPNCLEVDSKDGKKPTIALRDIKRGEELTIDYYSFDNNYKKGVKKIKS